jgi:hypothetical protein
MIRARWPVDRQVELLTLERLERRRGETWPGLWLAPLLTIVAQAFLLLVLADEGVGWLARAAVLVAALAANLAAIWSVLRAHAREVQYSEAIDAELAAIAVGDYADVRPAALARPRRRHPSAAPPRPAAEAAEADEEEPEEAELAAESGPDTEDETRIIDPTPTPPPPPVTGVDEDPPEPREDWVRRWDRHLTWWASGESHAKAYMAWAATLALFMVADVAILLAAV